MTEFRNTMRVEYIDHMGTDKRPAEAARVSTGADVTRPHQGLIRKLMWEEPPHSAPFEHCQLTVRVEVTKRVAWEWMRHRTQSFSELSTRYAHIEPTFYLPPLDRPIMQEGKPMDYQRGLADEETMRWLHSRRIERANQAVEDYEEELARGISREVAADNLPNYFFTSFYASANLRNWLGFLELRTDKHALWEFQEAATMVEGIIADLWPSTYSEWRDKREDFRRAWELLRHLKDWEIDGELPRKLMLVEGGAS